MRHMVMIDHHRHHLGKKTKNKKKRAQDWTNEIEHMRGRGEKITEELLVVQRRTLKLNGKKHKLAFPLHWSSRWRNERMNPPMYEHRAKLFRWVRFARSGSWSGLAVTVFTGRLWSCSLEPWKAGSPSPLTRVREKRPSDACSFVLEKIIPYSFLF